MTANPITDQLAAATKDHMTAGDPNTRRINMLGTNLGRYLTSTLPDLDPEIIGAILLHTSNCLSTVAADAADRRGDSVQREAKLVLNTLAACGQQLYTKTSGT